MQLYTEGPFDKVVTFLAVENYRARVDIPHAFDSIPDVAFLSGHTFNELISCEQRATEYAITKSGHMNKTITLPEVNPFTIGQLLYLFEVQTAFAGELLNINAFDQPGVEEGKNATYALLGKNGYQAKKAELDALFAEMEALETPEAKLYKAIDRIEAVIQHNEAPLDTWIELERTLNLEYGVKDCANFPFMAELRELAADDTRKKLADAE